MNQLVWFATTFPFFYPISSHFIIGTTVLPRRSRHEHNITIIVVTFLSGHRHRHDAAFHTGARMKLGQARFAAPRRENGCSIS